MNNLQMVLQKIRCICHKELLATLKDPLTKAILIGPIIIQSILFGYAATYNLYTVPYACLDKSHSRASSDFLAKLDGTGVFKRTVTLDNSSQIAENIDSGKVLLAVTIESDFADKLTNRQNTAIQIITDGRNTTTAGIALGYVNRIVSEFNWQRSGSVEPLKIETVTWYNPNQITRWNFMPGMIAMLSFIQVMLLAGLSVARERENGTFEQLLAAPVSPQEIMIGKAIPPILIGLVQSSLVLLVCLFWFKIPMAGSFTAIYAALLIFLLSSVGIGLSISAISSSMQQVMVYCFVLLMPMALLSGLATPVHNMPELLQLLTYADPLRFALDSVRRIYLEGAGIADVSLNFIPMLAVAAVTLPLAAWMFRNKLS